jgi:small-conductance mechanosensitive channel
MDIKSLVVGLAARYGIQVLSALVILIAGLLVGRWIGGLVDQRLRGRAMEPPMRVLLVRVLRVVVMLFAVLVALDKLGFQVAPLVAGIGVAGIGVGFALQGVLSNLVAGLTIIFTKPFRVGDYVEMLGVRGDVVAIDLSSTTLLHPDKEPPPAVGIAQVSDTGIRIGVNPWVRVTDVGTVEADLNRALVEQFRGRGVSLGLGPSDVRLLNGTPVAAR